ncbi:MAG: restriction endonuclease subunit S [Pseudomonadota bacterium]
MSLPRYPNYKDSGVAWLGEVPKHWEVKRLKQACQVYPSNVDKKSHDGEEPVLLCNYTDVYYNETITQEMNFMAATASADQIAKFTLRAGDTIITKDSETADDIAIAALVPHDLPGVVCGYHLSMVRPLSGTHGPFVKRLFDSIYAKSCFAVRANGLTRVGLGQYELDNVELPFPPLPEQTEIAAFLNRETAKIDELVAEQRRLMELLKEKRQAVISHAVTRGLNPDAPLKPSGIEWLGDVPEHWTCLQVGKVCNKVADGPHFSPSYVDEGIPFLSARNVKIDSWALDDVKYISANDCEEFDRRVVPEVGDVLYTKGGTTGIARVVDLPHRFQVWVHISVLKIKPELIEPYFLAFALNSVGCYEQSQLLTRGASNNDLGLTRLIKIWFALPKLDEQVAIVKFLKTESAKFESLTTEAQRAIDLLQERRTALISAAVTGQIDVRGAGAA